MPKWFLISVGGSNPIAGKNELTETVWRYEAHCRWMIPHLGQELSHGMTHYIPGKQVLVSAWLWKTNKQNSLVQLWWEFQIFTWCSLVATKYRLVWLKIDHKSKQILPRMVTQFRNPTQTYDRIKNIGFEVGILSVILGKCKNHVLYEVVLESQTFIWCLLSKDCGQKRQGH